MILIPPILDSVKGLWESIFGSRHSRDQQDAERYSTAYGEMSAEFTAYRENRTWFDSLVDGLNRLPRPAMVYAVGYYFYMAYADLEHFNAINFALANVPDPAWVILGLIVGFYFGGRMQVYSNQFKLKNAAVAQSAEPRSSKPLVEGSSPSPRSNEVYDPLKRFE